MRIHELKTNLWLPSNRDKLFEFFSDATNLEAITPAFLQFRVVSPLPIIMAEGALIDYRLKVHGFPLRWRTRINVWDPPHRFVDEQIRGPYRLWIHEHTFEPLNGGTMIHDHVRYAVPFDWFTHRLIVRPDVEKIFSHRTAALNHQFALP